MTVGQAGNSELVQKVLDVTLDSQQTISRVETLVTGLSERLTRSEESNSQIYAKKIDLEALSGKLASHIQTVAGKLETSDTKRDGVRQELDALNKKILWALGLFVSGVGGVLLKLLAEYFPHIPTVPPHP